MKPGASVYVPTEQFLATIINRSRGCGPTGTRIAEDNGSDKIGNNPIVYKWLMVAISESRRTGSRLTGGRGRNNPRRSGAYAMKCVREKWYQRRILCEQ